MSSVGTVEVTLALIFKGDRRRLDQVGNRQTDGERGNTRRDHRIIVILVYR